MCGKGPLTIKGGHAQGLRPPVPKVTSRRSVGRGVNKEASLLFLVVPGLGVPRE